MVGVGCSGYYMDFENWFSIETEWEDVGRGRFRFVPPPGGRSGDQAGAVRARVDAIPLVQGDSLQRRADHRSGQMV